MVLESGPEALTDGTALVTDRAVLASAVAATGHRIEVRGALRACGKASTGEGDHSAWALQANHAGLLGIIGVGLGGGIHLRRLRFLGPIQ